MDVQGVVKVNPITPDIEALRKEFEAYAAAPRRQEGDIDCEMLALALDVAIGTAQRRMKQIAKDRPQDYIMLEVQDGVGNRNVLRPVKK